MNAPGPGGVSIESLRDPAAYPHEVEAPVRLVETHVSWVLLTGPYAYKIKKPVKLAFLDYSTPSRRRAFCEEELRVNRRLAPGLYLETVPIVRTTGGLHVGDAAGAVVEHAVRMVQFDTREELDALVARGDVGRAELAGFGTELGRLHDTAPIAPAAKLYGSPALVKQVVADNFAELGRLVARDAARRQAARVRAWGDSVFDALEPLLNERRRSGWIRECHGDLHCANVVRWRGHLTPFDAIEFDPALRCIDVANDVAFLTMDLAARGRADLRMALLNAWVESLGDYAALPLLPYYETYRAVVRAKVAALRAGQARRDEASGLAAQSAVERYLGWASSRTERRTPGLVLTCGLSGSGKTWLARRLSDECDALHLRSDVERKRLAGLTPLADSRSPPDAGIYTREFNAKTYARLAECATACLQGGEHVIVDAASLRREERRELLQVATGQGVRAAIALCTAPIETLRSRIAARRSAGADASEADIALLDRQPAYWEPLTDDERRIAVVVDASRPHSVEDAVERLKATLVRD